MSEFVLHKERNLWKHVPVFRFISWACRSCSKKKERNFHLLLCRFFFKNLYFDKIKTVKNLKKKTNPVLKSQPYNDVYKYFIFSFFCACFPCCCASKAFNSEVTELNYKNLHQVLEGLQKICLKKDDWEKSKRL